MEEMESSEVQDQIQGLALSCDESVATHFERNISSPWEGRWAKRPKLADRKRKTVSLDVENASSWKLTVLSALKEIDY